MHRTVAGKILRSGCLVVMTNSNFQGDSRKGDLRRLKETWGDSRTGDSRRGEDTEGEETRRDSRRGDSMRGDLRIRDSRKLDLTQEEETQDSRRLKDTWEDSRRLKEREEWTEFIMFSRHSWTVLSCTIQTWPDELLHVVTYLYE